MALQTNLDRKLTPAQVKAAEREERQQYVIDEAIRTTPSTGPGSNGALSHVGAKNIVPTRDQVSEIDAFIAARRPSLAPKLIFDHDTRELREKRYTPTEREAIRRGYYCRHCDDLQMEVVKPEPMFAVPGWEGKKCYTVKGNSCGYPRIGQLEGQKWRITQWEKK